VPDAPVVLQNQPREFPSAGARRRVFILRKRSPTLLKDLGEILTEQFGFGDFVFRLPDLAEVGRAKDMNELEEQLRKVPGGKHRLHSQSNHFSHWLMARTEFALAAKLRPRKVSEFPKPRTSAPRPDRIDQPISPGTKRGADATFAPTFRSGRTNSFLRYWLGSLGGKARGLAFVAPLVCARIASRAASLAVRVSVPPSVVLATESSINLCPRTTFLILPCIAKTTPKLCAGFWRLRSLPLSPRTERRFWPKCKTPWQYALQPAGRFAIPAFHRSLMRLSCWGNQQPNPEDRLQR